MAVLDSLSVFLAILVSVLHGIKSHAVARHLMSFLMIRQDRGNISNAKVAGFQKDLKLTNQQFSVALTAF